ncbi:MAG: hypothetical protein KDK25_05230 [Leptospiraceae bacterium]|nr:hypothetical protein [Leptospiraceae bacterium]
MVSKQDPFGSFSAHDYLQEYYGNLGAENLFLLSFLHRTYEIYRPKVLCEIGSGPTIYQLISASRHAPDIHILEYLKPNREEIEAWLNNRSRFSWDPYFQDVAQREGPGAEAAPDIQARLRKCIRSIAEINLFLPLESSRIPDRIDTISSHFCVESITEDPDQFRTAWNNLLALVPGSGKLVMSLLKNARTYRAGDKYFPAYPVDEIFLQQELATRGFQDIVMETIPAEDERDYEGIICVRGVRS